MHIEVNEETNEITIVAGEERQLLSNLIKEFDGLPRIEIAQAVFYDTMTALLNKE